MPRALSACPSCHRQYEVGTLASGTAVRCRCGEVITVRATKPRSPRHLCCTNCGGRLRDRARSCDYCQAEITLEERRLDSICPECWARMAHDARYCMSCGVKIEPQAVEEVLREAPCPRCERSMRSRAVGAFLAIECGLCGGLWLEPETLQKLCERAEGDPEVEALLAGAPEPRAVAGGPTAAYLRCARCPERMTPRNFGGHSGVVFDVCEEHGVWLDHGELERILEFTRRGGLVESRRREVARLEKAVKRARERRVFDETNPQDWSAPLGGFGGSADAGVLGNVLIWLGGLFGSPE